MCALSICVLPAVVYLNAKGSLTSPCGILPAAYVKVHFPFFSPLQLKIQDVHLRFEDGVTNPSHPFAFGICIKNVSMQNAVNEPVSMNWPTNQEESTGFREFGVLPSSFRVM